eukprot:TRINITY_DN16317_c0_g1_i3.p1 TRINITY_DN16317_c0_g1~~TRINITY_DN16317_c0_g1_i3.p1  ORF type:complete len:119 (+),score=19.60 TRINITY_DN16317_c0_g1_i3:210-566(+)
MGTMVLAFVQFLLGISLALLEYSSVKNNLKAMIKKYHRAFGFILWLSAILVSHHGIIMFVENNPWLKYAFAAIYPGYFTMLYIAYHSPSNKDEKKKDCLLYTSPSPRDLSTSRMPSSA